MFYHSAYNLRIASDIHLPELPDITSGNDVEILLKPAASAGEVRSIDWSDKAAEALFSFPGAGRFLVRAGREVIVTPEQPADLALLRLYIQGMMLAALLYQRGLFVLHSSLVNIEGCAIAFVGPVGAGNSTLSAAFHARGHSAVADDNAALDLHGTSPMVQPGFPSLKLYPAAAASLCYDRHMQH